MYRKLSLISLCFLVVACATTAKNSIISDLKAAGISSSKAHCIGSQLEERLSAREINEFSKFIRTLKKAKTPGRGLDAIAKIENPEIVGAITASGISCAFAP